MLTFNCYYNNAPTIKYGNKEVFPFFLLLLLLQQATKITVNKDTRLLSEQHGTFRPYKKQKKTSCFLFAAMGGVTQELYHRVKFCFFFVDFAFNFCKKFLIFFWFFFRETSAKVK